MKLENPIMNYLLHWFVALITPILLILTITRVLASPLFIAVEYRMPGFPADSYGFTQQDRLKIAPLALKYLFNNEGIEYLGDQTFSDGSPLYTERELNHMEDVKSFAQIGLNIWYGLLALIIGVGFWANRSGNWPVFARGAAQGGSLTMVLLAALLVLIAFNFQRVFVGFHTIFFEGDTWLFLFSDTLIRLFPMRFWQDAFIFIGGGTFGAGWLVWYLFSRRFI